MLSPAHATVMIIDDEPENLNVLGEMLRQEDWDVLAFPCGEMAIHAAAAADELPDLVLLDIRMPGLDGYEVCRHFKADERLSAIPIIFVSASSITADKVHAFAVGGVDYITKPFRQAEVLTRVRTHIALSRAHAQLLTQHAELQVHKLELVMQNEELRRTQVDLEAARARYFDLYNLAPVGYITVSEPGLILDINLFAANLLGVTCSKLLNRPLSHFVFKDDQELYYRQRKQLLASADAQN
jgi:DNA-binding response OmpR family regulator